MLGTMAAEVSAIASVLLWRWLRFSTWSDRINVAANLLTGSVLLGGVYWLEQLSSRR